MILTASSVSTLREIPFYHKYYTIDLNGLAISIFEVSGGLNNEKIKPFVD